MDSIQADLSKVRLVVDVSTAFVCTFSVLFRQTKGSGSYVEQTPTVIYNFTAGNNMPTVGELVEGLLPQAVEIVKATGWTPESGTVEQSVYNALCSIPWNLPFTQASKRARIILDGQFGPMLTSRS